MTISVAPTKFRYEGNGVTTTFAFDNRVVSASELVVERVLRDSATLVDTLALTTDYTVSLESDGQASITITNAAKIPSTEQDVIIRLSLPLTQTVDLPRATPLPAQKVEDALDKLTLLLQLQNEAASRAISYSSRTTATSSTMPEPVNNHTVLFDGVSGNFKVGPGLSDIADLADCPLKLQSSRTVNIPTDYATLQEAIDTESLLFHPGQGVTITLNVESGHEPASGIVVRDGDYSHFVITCDDAALTVSSSFPLNNVFIWGFNARMPTIDCLVDGNGRIGTGYRAEEGSGGTIRDGNGITNCYGSAILVFYGGTVYANNCDFTNNAQVGDPGSSVTAWAGQIWADGSDVSDSGWYGIQAAHGGTVNFAHGTANNCPRYGIRATDGARIDADGATAINNGNQNVYAFNNSTINFRSGTATGATLDNITATGGSTIHCRDSVATGAGNYGLLAVNGSIIDADEVDVSNAGYHGAYAVSGSVISANALTANDVGTTTSHHAVVAEWGSTIDINLATIDNPGGDCVLADHASTISCDGATLTNAGLYAVASLRCSRIDAENCVATGAATYGAYALRAGEINARAANFRRNGVSDQVTDFVISQGGRIYAGAGLGGVSHTVNTLSVDGYILK